MFPEKQAARLALDELGVKVTHDVAYWGVPQVILHQVNEEELQKCISNGGAGQIM
jgi:hypothetical protein